MAVTADQMIGSRMSMNGALRDEILTRMESLAAAGEPIAPKQIAMDICSDTPPDDLARMMLEIAPFMVYQVAADTATKIKHLHSDGTSHPSARFSDGSDADISRMHLNILVPGFGDVRIADLQRVHCERLAEHHQDLAGRHTNIAKLWTDAGKTIRASKAETLGEVMTGDQLEALWAKYARSGARSAA